MKRLLLTFLSCTIIFCTVLAVTHQSESAAKDSDDRTQEELDKYRKSSSHFRHAIGWPGTGKRWERGRSASIGYANSETDRAWSVMLYKQGIIDKKTAVKLLTAIRNSKSGGERAIKRMLKGDGDTASAANIGRTRQEPMCRIIVRQKQLDVLRRLLITMEATLDTADKHAETIMNGQTHMANAQPTTYGAYLVANYDVFERGFEQIELAYSHTNKCSLGCGALAGTGWPIDRMQVAKMLGFDDIVEPSYDCEAGQDHALTTLFALTNITNHLSRTAMDHYIWMMDGNNWFDMPGPWLQSSSMMPQKRNIGCVWEHIHINGASVAGSMMKGMLSCHNQPYQDQLPIYQAWKSVDQASLRTEHALSIYGNAIQEVQPNKELLLKLAQEGYACSAEVKIVLVRDKGYGLRHAHRIVGTFCRMAAERKIPANQAKAALLDEAAEFLGEKKIGLSDKELHDLLDPVKFLERHNNVGDPNPNETRRMIASRRAQMVKLKERHQKRRDQLKNAHKTLLAEIDSIIGSSDSKEVAVKN